jgi:hypothetical protein
MSGTVSHKPTYQLIIVVTKGKMWKLRCFDDLETLKLLVSERALFAHMMALAFRQLEVLSDHRGGTARRWSHVLTPLRSRLIVAMGLRQGSWISENSRDLESGVRKHSGRPNAPVFPEHIGEIGAR